MSRILIALTLGFVGAGCSRSLPSLPKSADVKGTIKLPDGQYLGAGRLEFQPLGGIDTEPFGDVVNGQFSIFNAIPGKYKVTVCLVDYNDQSGSPRRFADDRVPPRYTDPATTDLEVEVKEGSNNLQLEMKP
jgi:hypothetical protein